MTKQAKQPSVTQWKHLYDLSEKLYELAPWRWMEEIDVFGVENPETKEIGFVSVMGTLGEHSAVGVYLGADALYKFWGLQDEDVDPVGLDLLEIPQIQVSFEDRGELEKEDRDIIKKLGLRFRGPDRYPKFRNIKPGHLPWFITSEEAQFLSYAIEQTLEVAPRLRDNPSIFTVEDDPKDEVYLVRTAEMLDGKTAWHDEMKRISPPAVEKPSISMPPGMVDRLKGYPHDKKLVFEMDLFSLPTPIGKKGERPLLPIMLMVSDHDSFFILGAEFLEPREDISEMNAVVADSLFEILSRHKILPGEIRVGSDLLFGLLKTFTQRLNIKLRQTGNLRAIKDAKNAIIDQLSGKGF